MPVEAFLDTYLFFGGSKLDEEKSPEGRKAVYIQECWDFDLVASIRATEETTE